MRAKTITTEARVGRRARTNAHDPRAQPGRRALGSHGEHREHHPDSGGPDDSVNAGTCQA